MSDILIYQTEDGRTRVNLLVQEHTVWLNQSQLAELLTPPYQTSQRISKIYWKTKSWMRIQLLRIS